MSEEYYATDTRSKERIERMHRPVTMNLDIRIVEYFKNEASRTGIPYQRLINLYLAQCVGEGKRLEFV